jgi:hypothetical protein
MGGLFGSAVLDVAIGLIFVYLLLSILCAAANGWIAGVTKSRSVVLKRSIAQLSQSPKFRTLTFLYYSEREVACV